MNSFILPGKQLKSGPLVLPLDSRHFSLSHWLNRDSFQLKRLRGRRALAVSNVDVPLVYSREMHIQIDNANAAFVLPANEFLSVK